MQSELKSLSKIFSEVIFRIPDYQRGYSWEEKHLKDFWNDIEQLQNSKSHYTGVLTLEPVKKRIYERWEDDIWIIESKHYEPMYVVDGQQRLTTAVVFVQAILESIDDDELLNYTEKSEITKKYIFETKRDAGISKSYIFGYEKDNPSYEFLKQEIFNDASIIHSTMEETIYTKNLRNAKNYFSKKLENLDKPAKEKIFTKLTQHLLFNIFYIEKDLDVFVTFETMNNRGKPLSHLELLKNRLIYLSTKFTEDKIESEQLRKAINESWKSVYHYLGKINSADRDDDDFLRLHYIFYFSPDLDHKEDDYLLEFRRTLYQDRFKDILLDETFTPKRLGNCENPLVIDDIFKYSQSLKKLVKSYYETATPSAGNFSATEKTRLEQINRQSGYFLSALAATFKLKKGKERELLLTAIERFGFLQRFTPYYFNRIDILEETIHLLTGRKNTEQLTKAINQVCDEYTETSEFLDAIKTVGNNAKNGYYGWSQVRYFMYEYEQELRRRSKTRRNLLDWSSDSDYSDHKTIEHIYPQKAQAEYWKSAFSDYSIKQRNVLRNSLGNLLPVSHEKNAALSNKGFDIKKGSASNQVGYRYGCLSEIQVSLSEQWDAIEILRRGIYLLNFMESRWGVRIGSTKEKVQALGLEFVLNVEDLKISDLEVERSIPTPILKSLEKQGDTPLCE